MEPWGKNHGRVSDKKLLARSDPPVGAVYDRALIVGSQPVVVQIRNIVRGHRPRLQGDRKLCRISPSTCGIPISPRPAARFRDISKRVRQRFRDMS